MSISEKYRKDLNRSMEAARQVLLGDFVDHGTTVFSASGTMMNQNSNLVNITGGTITGVAISGSMVNANTAASAVNYTTGGGIDVAINLRISASTLALHTNATGSDVHGLGTVSTQNANNVSISGSFSGTIISGSAKFGTGDDYTAFESDGTMTLSGSATVWDDMLFPLVTAKQGQTDKPAFDANEVAYLFPSNDTSASMLIVAQFPHSYKVGSDVDPHVHWKQTQSGSPVFKMAYKWFGIGAQVPANWTIHSMGNRVVPYTSGSLHQLNYGSTMISASNLVSDGYGVSSIMLIKLYRDDNAYTGNAITYQFDIHFQKDGLGSRTEYSK